MGITILHPEEDQHGNSKENIIIALGEDGAFLGSAYAWPYENHHQTYERPWNVFFSISPATENEALKAEVKKALFAPVMARSKELRALKPDLNARIYTLAQDKEELQFFVACGLADDDCIMSMEADVAASLAGDVPAGYQVIERDLADLKQFQAYREVYNDTFVNPMDMDELEEQKHKSGFAVLDLYDGGVWLASASVFGKSGKGQLETLLVLPQARGRGIAKIMMRVLFRYFLQNGLKKTTLEVWRRNARAVRLYESFGYRCGETNLFFPGIDL